MASNSRILHELRDYSFASSTGSNHGTISNDSTMNIDFNPARDEASVSTQQLRDHYSQKLPQLRTTAKNYGRWAPRDPTDIKINTSAIGRAFPGFSDGSSSDNSIEFARAPKTSQRPSPSRVPQPEYSDNFDISQPVNTGSIKVLSTPQRFQTKTSVLQEALRNHASKKEISPRRDTGSHKENIPPLNTQKPASLSPYTSHASRTTSGERRTLAELHAQVADDTEGSLIGDNRPTITFQSKNTRFSNVKSQQTSTAANVSTKRQEVEDDLAEKLRVISGTPTKAQLKSHNNSAALSNTPNPTQQSFILPNMAHISEATPTSFNKGTGVSLPGEEQDIYANIDLLQDRVADLEAQLTEARQLQSITQGERFKFQMERDQAMTQLSELLSQNEHLEIENRELRQFQSLNQDERVRFQTEQDRAVAQAVDLLSRNERLEKQVTGLGGQKQQLEKRTNDVLARNERLEKRVKDYKFEADEANIALAEYKRAATKMAIHTDNTTQSLQHTTRSLEQEERKSRRQQEVITTLQNVTAELLEPKRQSSKNKSSNRNRRRVTLDHSEHPYETQPSNRHQHQVPKDRLESASKDKEKSYDGNERSTVSDIGSDYASIVGPGYMKALSQKLKETRVPEAEGRDYTFQTIQSRSSSQAPSIIAPAATQKTDRFQNQEDLTGRLSIKSVSIEQNGEPQNQEDLTGRFSIKSAGRIKDEHTIRSTASHRRHHSETSVHTTRRRRNEMEDVTSAFIIPDISSNPITAESVHLSLSTSARQVLDSLCKHDCINCTVCSRIASFDTKKNDVVIPKPIPVSERMPEPAHYEDEPTMRPSVDPSLALATLIKKAEDELAHLKMEHTRITTAYTKHDASLGMRKRTALKKRIDELLTLIEEKSDQVYGLYDVLEGQQAAGSEEGVTEELPWEGIDE